MPAIAPLPKKEESSLLEYLIPFAGIGAMGYLTTGAIMPSMCVVLGVGFLGEAFLRWRKETRQAKDIPMTKRLEMAFGWTGIYGVTRSGESIPPKLLHHWQKDHHHHLIYSIPIGFSIESFEARNPLIEQAAGGKIDYNLKNGHLHLDVWEGFLVEKINFLLKEPPEDMDLAVYLGKSNYGDEWISLAEQIHTLVGGATGYGKSNILRLIALYLLNYQLEDMQMFIVDFTSKSQFPWFEEYVPVLDDLTEVYSLLMHLNEERKRREKMLYKARKIKKQYYDGDDMPYIVLIIDEFTDFTPLPFDSDQIRHMKKACLALVNELAAKARKVGIHLVIGVQRPDRDSVPGNIKANFPCTIGFKVRNKTNSEILLDTDSAAHIKNVGRCILQNRKGEEKEIQTMLTDEDNSHKYIPEIWKLRLEEAKKKAPKVVELKAKGKM